MENKNKIQQLSIGVVVFLHLLPGFIILFLSILFANPNWGLGLPIFLSLLLAILFGLIPVELGLLYYVARKQGKKLREILGYTTKMPIGKTLLWALPCFVIAMMSFGFIKNIEHELFANIFDWVPTWFKIDVLNIGSGSSLIIWLTIVLNFLLSGILGPLVEELYFRGYLLPRMERFGKWAALTNTVLFSIYHFFTPWENITRIVGLAPMVYAVWYKKNIRIGIIVHCVLNIVSAVMLAAVLLG